jgi:hypothetical protein
MLVNTPINAWVSTPSFMEMCLLLPIGVLTNISLSNLGLLIISLSTKLSVPPDVKQG